MGSITGHYDEITTVRVLRPELILELAQERKRRTSLTNDGHFLNIIAADHPARRVTLAGADPFAMANREDYLQRIVDILSADAADGVMATMDILEELLILSYIAGRRTGLLDEKVLIVSLNRGGLSKTSWELDDPITGATPADCQQWNMDGAKMLLRIDDNDDRCLNTIQYCCDAISELTELGLPMFLEPLPVVRTGETVTVKKDAESLAAITGVASALGSSSSRLWLKLPYCENFEFVARSTTLPILLLGGESQGSGAFLTQMESALNCASNVRGAMVGRNVLFSTDQTHVSMAASVHALVHKIPVKS